MTLEQTFFLSHTIAAAAVVISIIYLGRQVHQAERVQRAIMHQGRADRTSKASMTMAHLELACIWQKALSAEPDLTREEFAQCAMWHVSRAQYGPDFQLFVDGLLATLPDSAPPDAFAVWQERLKAELRPRR